MGSVHFRSFRCGRAINDNVIANFLSDVPVNEFEYQSVFGETM